jgi:transposase InsO family protein
MEQKLLAVFEARSTAMSVSELCRVLGISRDSYYRYRRRFEDEGPAGLVPRSRRPHRSPQLMSADLEEEIVRLRKELPLDRGAQTIAYHLERGGWQVPSVRAIHRALVRRGMVVPDPTKRPKSALWRRFEWPLPNGAWQIDATHWVLADGVSAWVMDLLDDHSRVVIAARAHPGPTTEAAFDAFSTGVARWGLPARVMSDNGTCFTGRFVGGENEFEQTLRSLGIRHMLSSPAHPQTCGKLERFHQTLKKWLAGRPLAASLAELQDQLDQFSDFYNHDRPHRALTGATPIERWRAQPPDTPGDPIALPITTGLRKVGRDGAFGWGKHVIQAGAAHAHTRLLVIGQGNDITVLNQHGIVRRLTINPDRRYQPYPRRGRTSPT